MVSTFSRQEWESPEDYKYPDEVKIVEFIDWRQQEMELQMAEMQEAAAMKDAEYNPLKKKKVVSATVAEKAKPEGSKFAFVANNLESNTVYEFRIAFRNATGLSLYSIPSLRAKTNKAEAPKIPLPPRIASILPSAVHLLLDIPAPGGSPVTHLVVEAREMEANVTTTERFVKTSTSKEQSIYLANLRSTKSYVFRSRADNLVGAGEYSVWTDEVELPKAVTSDPEI